jgi:hypothetical protein
MTVNRTEPGTIEAQAEAAARNRNGNGHRPPARGLLETAAAVMRELYANPLIALLDAEGLGAQLSEADRDAVLHLVRSLEARAPLPQRQPGGTGAQPAVRL